MGDTWCMRDTGITHLPVFFVNSKNLLMVAIPAVSSEVLMVSCHFTPDKGWDGDTWCRHYRTAQNMCIRREDLNITDCANHPHFTNGRNV